MCIKTKTTYGCGCSIKQIDDCHSSRCEGVERYRIERQGDCRDCKSGGVVVTRGREGKGRYGQEITRRNSNDNTTMSSSRGDLYGGASAWAPSPVTKRDEWHSPTRQKADSAWEREHEARIEDLSHRAEKLSVSSSPRPVPHRRNTNDSYESDRDRVQIQIDDRDYRSRRSGPTSRKLFAEIESDRYNSRESVNTLPRLQMLSKSKRDVYDPYDSGYASGTYGSYDSRRSQSGRARTEPYMYSPVTHKGKSTKCPYQGASMAIQQALTALKYVRVLDTAQGGTNLTSKQHK